MAPFEQLEQLRKQIDQLDRSLLMILAKRMKISAKVGRIKKRAKMARFQKQRWLAVLADRISAGRKLGLNSDFVGQLFHVIHRQSLKIQQEPPKSKTGKRL